MQFGDLSINMILFIFLFGGLLFGKLFQKVKLPTVLGMVVFGICASLLFKDDAPPILFELAPSLKSLALTVILLRAGLGLSRAALKKAGINAILMSFLPCILEASAVTVAMHYLFHFDWVIAALTASMISAVSPAVIVPTMLDLKSKGFGKRREVPTVVLAGASFDDVFAIALFSLFLLMGTSPEEASLSKSLLSIPYSILFGLIPGLIAGFFLTEFLKRHHEKIRATEKSLLLLTTALVLVEVGNKTHTTALLGVMGAALVMFERAPKVAGELSMKLSKVWVFAEIILFVLIGFSVDMSKVFEAGGMGLIILAIGLFFRSIGVFISTAFGDLTMKERLFCIIAYTPKATVQAALGSVALDNGIAEGEIILALALLSIVVTAPIGLIGITLGGKKLLEAPEKETTLSKR